MSGVGADNWYGLSKKFRLNFNHPRETFDNERIKKFNEENMGGILQQQMLSENYNKIFVAPYVGKHVEDFFMQYSWEELHQNKTEKYHVRTCYKNEFDKLNKIKTHLNLQLVSKTNIFFENLLKDKEINFKNRIRVMDICRDWSLLNTNTLEEFIN